MKRSVGGKKIPIVRVQQGLLLSLALLGVAGCTHAINDALQSGFHGADQWSGPVAPRDSNCGSRTTGLMTLGARKFSFDPFGSVIVVQGAIEKDRLDGSASEAAPGQTGGTLHFAGTINHPAGGPPVIQGMMKSGRCTWNVVLHRD